MSDHARVGPAGRIVIDRRPIWIILLERSLRPAAFGLLGWGFYAAVTLSPPEGLTVAGLRALAVFALCLVLWVTGLLPLAVTSLLALVLVPLAGVMAQAQAYALFGNQAIFFLLGAFILAAAMMRTGLSARLALAFLRRVGTSPGRLTAGVMAVAALTCLAMPHHAAAALLFPIVLEVIHALDLRPRRSRYARGLLLACAWGAAIGSNLTLVSSARAALALGFLAEAGIAGVPYRDWTLLAAPMVAAQLAAGLVVVTLFYRPEITSIEPAIGALAARMKGLGKVTMDERLAGLVVLGATAAWALGGQALGLAAIAIVAGVALFALRVLTWKDAEDYVNWGIFLLYGGAIALGTTLDRSGASAWVAGRTLGAWIDNPAALVVALSILSVLLSEAMSNSAVVAAVVPLGIALAQSLDADPRVVTMGVVMPAGLAFALPTATPAMALAYSYGGLSVRDTLVPGMVAAAVCWALFLAMIFLWAPVVGYGLSP